MARRISEEMAGSDIQPLPGAETISNPCNVNSIVVLLKRRLRNFLAPLVRHLRARRLRHRSRVPRNQKHRHQQKNCRERAAANQCKLPGPRTPPQDPQRHPEQQEPDLRRNRRPTRSRARAAALTARQQQAHKSQHRQQQANQRQTAEPSFPLGNHIGSGWIVHLSATSAAPGLRSPAATLGTSVLSGVRNFSRAVNVRLVIRDLWIRQIAHRNFPHSRAVGVMRIVRRGIALPSRRIAAHEGRWRGPIR